MKLYLIRHGTTEWMEVKKLHGSADSPLSEEGKRQAQQAARALKGAAVERLYSSPQGRAIETAAYIAGEHGLTPQPLEWLREMDFGVHEGSTHGPYQFPIRFIRRPLIKLLHAVNIKRFGESWAAITRRVSGGLDELLEQEVSGGIVLVSHTLTLKTLTEVLVKRYKNDMGGESGFVRPASISEFELERQSGCLRLVRYDDISHYDGKAA